MKVKTDLLANLMKGIIWFNLIRLAYSGPFIEAPMSLYLLNCISSFSRSLSVNCREKEKMEKFV